MNWDEDDQALAEREGWWISYDVHSRLVIQRIDQADFGVQLNYDNEAWELVWSGALEGRDLHVRALTYLWENSRNEFLSIARHIGRTTNLRMSPVYGAVEVMLLRESGDIPDPEREEL